MVPTNASLLPPHSIFAAFGASEPPEQLAGGRGLSWRSGQIVVRPTADAEEASWKSDVLAEIDGAEGFAVPRPIRDYSGNWVHDGWQAIEWIPGAADETRVRDVVRTGQAFHRTIAGLPCPAFIASSDDPWSNADRIAWGEMPVPDDTLLQRLVAHYLPVDSLSQVIHGDLLGNVLFAEGRPPAIIDWAPYWRPSGLGAAIAVVDAACWHGYPLDALSDTHGISQWRQLLLRALVFRMVTLHLLGRWDDQQTDRHTPVAAAIIALVEK